MTFHIYSNSGTLDLRALTVMGMNAKTSEGAIGYFGTGLKYAIATLKRYDCDIHISDGAGNAWTVESRPTTFRGQEFKELVLEPTSEGEPIVLPFTTDLGKDWELWMALREIESNMRDEGGNYCTAENLHPQHDIVHIAIRGAAYNTCVIRERETIFFDLVTMGRDVTKVGAIEFLPTVSPYLYVNGIRATILGDHGLTVNVNKAGMLSEDRMVKGMFAYEQAVRNTTLSFSLDQWRFFIQYVKNMDFLPLTIMMAELKSLASAELKKEAHTDLRVPIEVYEVLRTRRDLGGGMYYDSLMDSYDFYLASKRHESLEGNRDMLGRAINLLQSFCYDIEREEIVVQKTLGVDVMGYYRSDTKKIYLAEEVFNRGQTFLNAVLLEEVLHKVYGFHDETRSFQSHLMHALTARLEEINAIERWAAENGHMLPINEQDLTEATNKMKGINHDQL
jgi:hypothetical protein